MKQKSGDVLTYSMRIEQLQNLIIEQETADLHPETAKQLNEPLLVDK